MELARLLRPTVAEQAQEAFARLEPRQLVARAEMAPQPEAEMASRLRRGGHRLGVAAPEIGPSGSNLRGSSNTVSSFVADASATRTIDPSGTTRPCHSTSVVTIRPSYGTGGA